MGQVEVALFGGFGLGLDGAGLLHAGAALAVDVLAPATVYRVQPGGALLAKAPVGDERVGLGTRGAGVDRRLVELVFVGVFGVVTVFGVAEITPEIGLVGLCQRRQQHAQRQQ